MFFKTNILKCHIRCRISTKSDELGFSISVNRLGLFNNETKSRPHKNQQLDTEAKTQIICIFFYNQTVHGTVIIRCYPQKQ